MIKRNESLRALDSSRTSPQYFTRLGDASLYGLAFLFLGKTCHARRDMKGTERHIALELLSDAVRDGREQTRLQVRGTCMHPLVQDGDWVRARPLDRPLRRGQLVVARDAQDQLVCHRVLSTQDSTFRLAGDRAFAVEDHPRRGPARGHEKGPLRRGALPVTRKTLA